MSGDIVNAVFEGGMAIILLLNTRNLYRDKQVKGVSVFPFVFACLWGAWNLYYYPSLGQWLSFAAGLGVVVANTLWVLLALWYTVAVPCQNAVGYRLRRSDGLWYRGSKLRRWVKDRRYAACVQDPGILWLRVAEKGWAPGLYTVIGRDDRPCTAFQSEL